MPDQTASYVFDTSAFINGWHEHYPYESLRQVWELIGKHIYAGIIIVPVQVKEEIQKQDDAVWEWYSAYRRLALDPTQEVLDLAKAIMEEFPNWVRPHGKYMQNGADPYLVAWAKCLNIPVVTYEDVARDEQTRIKLGLVCRRHRVKHFMLGEYLRRELR